MSEYIAKCNEVVGISGKPLIVPDYIDTSEEIVRCRDCKEFAFGDIEYATVDWCDYWGAYVESPDGFCAWGERRQP